jgi:hypothetical protein
MAVLSDLPAIKIRHHGDNQSLFTEQQDTQLGLPSGVEKGCREVEECHVKEKGMARRADMIVRYLFASSGCIR